MTTRITVDLGDTRLARQLRLEAAREGTSIRQIVVRAVEAYLSSRREDLALAKLAESAFAEWDNEEDAAYDRL